MTTTEVSTCENRLPFSTSKCGKPAPAYRFGMHLCAECLIAVRSVNAAASKRARYQGRY